MVSGGAVVLGIVFSVDWGTVCASTVPGMVVVVDMLQLFKKFLREKTRKRARKKKNQNKSLKPLLSVTQPANLSWPGEK